MPDADTYLAELKRGTPAAVERLVGEYEGPLFRYFLAIHGDAALAGDQSADAFVELVRALPKMRGGSEKLRGFVYAIAKNIERRRWRQRPTGEHTLDAVAATACPHPSPERSAEQNESLQLALKAIQSLDPTTRNIFLLRFVEQLSINEVATTLDLAVGTVKSRIHRGRQELQTLLATSEEEA